VLHWGDLGGQWGVNRSVAQIHALLYLSDRPLTAEDIAGMLGIARSNVSNSLRELLGWIGKANNPASRPKLTLPGCRRMTAMGKC